MVKGAMIVARLLAIGTLLSSVGAACSDPERDQHGRGTFGPEHAPWPDGLEALVVRDYPEYSARTAYVRLTSSESEEMTVTRAVVSSPRFEDVAWTGESTFTELTELEFEVPSAKCEGPIDLEVTITFSTDDGPLRVARTRAEDRSGLLANTLNHDCAERTLREAAVLRVGKPRVTGAGRNSFFTLPVVLDPTGKHPEVIFRGFGATVLFRHVAGSTEFDDGARIRMAGHPKSAPLQVEPGRCDRHALMEGARGTYIPVFVEAPAVPPYAFFHLPLNEDQRGALMSFFAAHCGLGQ